MKAIWNNTVIAESNDTVVVENNHYFPPDSVNVAYLTKNGNQYTCRWKGVGDYYDVTVDGETAKGAAWMYPDPSEDAKNIQGHYAFWQGVEVTE